MAHPLAQSRNRLSAGADGTFRPAGTFGGKAGGKARMALDGYTEDGKAVAAVEMGKIGFSTARVQYLSYIYIYIYVGHRGDVIHPPPH